MRKGKLFRLKKLGRASADRLASDFYVFGLGNPGAEYAHTRHNAGFDTLDILAQKNNAAFSLAAYQGICAKVSAKNGRTALLIKPQTYMNHSGRCVRDFVSKLNIDFSRIVVVYDDLDLNPAGLRIRPNGSAGTHNGLKSIIYQLGRDDFTRVRIGIGRPENGGDVVRFVLGRFSKQEQGRMFSAYTAAGDAVMELIENGIESAMRTYNTKGGKND